MLQQFVYENYPNNKDLVREAKKRIQFLGGASFNYPAGGISKFFVKIIGWKYTKHLQLLSKRASLIKKKLF